MDHENGESAVFVRKSVLLRFERKFVRVHDLILDFEMISKVLASLKSSHPFQVRISQSKREGPPSEVRELQGRGGTSRRDTREYTVCLEGF